MILSIVLLFAIWLLPAHGKPISEQREQSQLLKFVASLMVVLGHETMFYCDFPPIVVKETSYGQLCVAFFLFMSGYGLAFAAMNRSKGKPLTWGWLGKRLLKLLVPALTATLLYMAVRLCCGMEVDWEHLLKWWFVSDVNLRYGWYVTEILLLYILFFLCHHWWSGHRAFLLMDVGICIAILLLLITAQPVWYIMGLPCFMLGSWIARWEHRNKHEAYRQCSEVGVPEVGIKMLMSMVAILFLLAIRFDWVQKEIPALDKWRYMYLSFYLADVLFVLLMGYLLMRLPVCKRMLNGGGTSTKYILYKGLHFSFAEN